MPVFKNHGSATYEPSDLASFSILLILKYVIHQMGRITVPAHRVIGKIELVNKVKYAALACIIIVYTL